MPDTDTTTIEPVLGNDGKPFDPARQQHTITAQRLEVAELTKERNWLRDSLRAVASGRPLTPDQQAAVEFVTPTAQQADLSAVAAILGLGANPADPASVVEAAKQSRLSAELYGIMVEAGAEPKLTRAVLNDSRALVDIDLTADDVTEQLKAVVSAAVTENPNLKVRSQTATRSGMEIHPGSGGAPAPISREALAYLPASEVNRLRQSGALSHLDVAPDR